MGRKIVEVAGRLLRRVALELSGNNAFVVLIVADVELAATAGMFGSFLHQGQIRMATGRHLAYESIATEYTDALTRRAAALRIGDPYREDVELGPLIDDGHLQRVPGLMQGTLQAGGRATTGAKYDKLFYRHRPIRARAR